MIKKKQFMPKSDKIIDENVRHHMISHIVSLHFFFGHILFLYTKRLNGALLLLNRYFDLAKLLIYVSAQMTSLGSPFKFLCVFVLNRHV